MARLKSARGSFQQLLLFAFLLLTALLVGVALRSVFQYDALMTQSRDAAARALTLSGSHGIFKGGRIEQLYRDGALGALHAPPSDFCLWNMGIHELGLDPAEITPPLKPAAT